MVFALLSAQPRDQGWEIVPWPPSDMPPGVAYRCVPPAISDIRGASKGGAAGGSEQAKNALTTMVSAARRVMDMRGSLREELLLRTATQLARSRRTLPQSHHPTGRT